MKQKEWDGRQLRIWRTHHGLTVPELANALGMSAKRVYSLELGYVPTLDQAHKITRRTNGAIRYRDIYNEFDPRYA